MSKRGLKVTLACRLFGHCRQVFYQLKADLESALKREQAILENVREIRKEDPGIGGYKLWLMLCALFVPGFMPGRDSFYALLHRHGLMLPPRKVRHTTNSNHRYHKWKNLVKDLVATEANYVWVADITYIDLADGNVCYLHLITDAYSHKIVGWMLADTFRAAAVEQLCIWGERVGVPVVKQKMGADPASVAYDTLSSAVANGADIVIIYTAGRLHNKVGLMNELTKIKTVMKKVVPDAPDEVLLVLDGSTGQNAFEQAKQFTLATEVTAMAITKLDGTAKGGVVIGISDQFKIPVKYIGLGEGMEDLQLFNRMEFVDSLFGGNK